MKLMLYLIFTSVTCVSFLLYLNTVDTFLPLMETGSYNWINILTVIILLCVAVFSILGVIITLVQILFKKGICNISWYTSIKYSGIVTLFLLALGILHFFHIFAWYWIMVICILLGILIIIV